MNIRSRRGTKPSQSRRSLVVLLQCFILTTLAILAVGYYLFYKSSPGNTVLTEGFRHGNIRVSGIAGSVRRHHANDSGGTYDSKATIGYAITVSGCPKDDGSRGDFGAGITDGAAVLKHSIHMNSIRNAESGSKYDYKMYALVHPEAEHCARPTLEPLGYEVLVRNVPVRLQDIRGDYLREKVPKNGCCGEKEFVKLHAYTLVDHPAIVHLDLDTLVLKPMDNLFNVMIDGPPPDGSNGGIEVAFGDPLVSSHPGGSNEINAFFTRDYNMAHRGMQHVGVQGGFLVLRPSLIAFAEFSSIIRKGDFRSNGGWGGLGFGPFYGSMTFQGIIPYFYDHLHPGTGVELNHCVYNNMADNPRDKPTKNDVVSGSCRDGYNRPDKNDQCEDCRSRPIEDVVTTHFTLCQKPWECLAQDGDRIQERLCRKFHAEWYRIRENLETTTLGQKQVDLTNQNEVEQERGGKYQPQHFRGYCKSSGKKGYIAMKVPSSTS
ncbi:hypothetical protein HJC23_002221 [Cyclotella cryptica]|uniref:Glycosyltransferase family 8 protein n=1 Tax=Cyclotella cryptica TaxID=29204 RepID=A0ABD3P2T9_9STRA|eukprot:CCRYP_017879-RA/>CCRYP_017879-RA protein AED:0.05 eAED:0.05 QI:337/1/1/1/0.33/0.25/4/753/488